MTKVFIATDHAGFELKNSLIPYIGSLGYEVEDMGALELDPEDDYPDFITPCAKAVHRAIEAANNSGAKDVATGIFGIILGGSGNGEAMAANRVSGIRAAVFYGGSLELVQLAREHNDANVLSLGARFLTLEEAQAAVGMFLDTPFSTDARHARRIEKF